MTAIAFLIFLSCNQSSSTNPLSIEDSLSKLKVDSSNNQTRTDSFTLLEQDKAINEIKFGITKKVFNKAKDRFMKKTALKNDEFYKNAAIITNKIGEYGFISLDGWFHNDSLYLIELQGCIIGYDEYQRAMPDQYTALIELLKSKYGEPKKNLGLPSWTEVEKGYFIRCAIWQIGNKTIEVRISCKGTYYTLNLAVFKLDIEKVIEAENEFQSKETTKKGTEKL